MDEKVYLNGYISIQFDLYENKLLSRILYKIINEVRMDSILLHQ